MKNHVLLQVFEKITKKYNFFQNFGIRRGFTSLTNICRVEKAMLQITNSNQLIYMNKVCLKKGKTKLNVQCSNFSQYLCNLFMCSSFTCDSFALTRIFSSNKKRRKFCFLLISRFVKYIHYCI